MAGRARRRGAGLADAIGAEEDDVGRIAQELQIEELIDEGPVDRLGVLPVEVDQRLHRRQLGGEQPTLEAATPSAPAMMFSG